MHRLGANALATSAWWQRVGDWLARYAWLVLLAAIAVAVVGGIVYAVVWQPDSANVQVEVAECEDPPCFGGGGLPGLRDLPATLPFLGYGLAIVLGLPSLLVGGLDVLRGRWAAGWQRLLVFAGPVLFLVGTEVVPHLVSPCVPAVLGADWLPTVCERTEQGVDIKDRWHPLHHALVGGLPMAVLYWRALHRWRPDVARGRRASSRRPR